MRPELAALLMLAAAGAAETSPAPAAVSVQLLSLSGDREDLALWDGRRATPIRLSADFLGPRLRYAGDPRLRLIKLPADFTPGSAAGPPTNDPPAAPGPTVAWLDLPNAASGDGPGRLILLVQPEPTGNGIIAMPDSDQDFPRGTVRVLNFCEFRLSFESADGTATVPAKGAFVLRPKAAPGGYHDAAIYSYEDQTRRLAYNLHFFVGQDRRTLLFVLPLEKGSGLVRLQPVEEPPPVGRAGSAFDAKLKPPKAK